MQEKVTAIFAVLVGIIIICGSSRGRKKARQTVRKSCKYCGSYIAYDATVCPNCRRSISGFGGFRNEAKAGCLTEFKPLALCLLVVMIGLIVIFVMDKLGIK